MPKFALLVGISEYSAGLNPLPAAPKDVAALKRVLLDPNIGGFAPADIGTLLNPDKLTLERAIYDLFANRKKDDLLLFYFSGHGIRDERGTFHFSSSSTEKANERLIPPTATAASYVHSQMSDSCSKRQVVILDCCFGGAFRQGYTAKDSGIVDLATQLGGEGRAILTASTSTQYAFEQENFELSIYTHFLVEGLATGAADSNDDGWISVDELHDYVSRKVRETNHAMTPELFQVRKEQEILLARASQYDPRVKYRKEVESQVAQSQGKLSLFALEYLSDRRLELKIAEAEAEAILEEILKPFREYDRKLQKFEQLLIRQAEQGYPFPETIQRQMENYHQSLGLREEDVLVVQGRVLGPKQAEVDRQQAQIRQQEQLQQQRLEQQRREQEQQEQQEQRRRAEERKRQEMERSRKKKAVQHFIEDLGKGIFIEMIAIPGGSFSMGSPENEEGRQSSESPLRTVMIEPFFMGKFVVTQAQWRVIAQLPKVEVDLVPDPARFEGDDCPVERISWFQAMEFCNRLSRKTNKTYRLPSEAEWEYACRAGTTTPFYFGKTLTTDLANFDGNYTYGSALKGQYRRKTMPVGSFPPNAFGLFDMHGNVWEWCADHWHEDYQWAPASGGAWTVEGKRDHRVVRGGSWDSNPRYCRSACRLDYDPGNNILNTGFRVVCDVSKTL